MSNILTVGEILDLAKISQYLAAQYEANQSFLKGGTLDNLLSRKIYMERSGIQYVYNLNQNDPNLRSTANYLYDLLGVFGAKSKQIKYLASITKPVVSGPSNQSVEAGNIATFTISVSSPVAYVIQWFSNGILIPGESGLSLSFTAQLADTGKTYNAIVTNSAGVGYSQTATLTVTQTIQGFAWYGTDDPYPFLERGIDNLSYQIPFSITDLQPLSVPFPNTIDPQSYIAVKYPNTQKFKTIWYNTQSNQGLIPDSVLGRIQLVGDYFVICTKLGNTMTIDTSAPMDFSGNVNPYAFQFILQPTNLTVNTNTPFTLTSKVAYGKANYTQVWRRNGNTAGNNTTNNPEADIFYVEPTPGTFTWQVTVTDSLGNQITSNQVTVTVN